MDRMECSETHLFFRALADGDSETAGINRAKRHVDGCTNCQQEYARYTALIAALQGLPREAPSPRVSMGIHQRLQADVQSNPQRRRRWWALGFAIPSLGVVILGSVLAFPPGPPESGMSAAHIEADEHSTGVHTADDGEAPLPMADPGIQNFPVNLTGTTLSEERLP